MSGKELGTLPLAGGVDGGDIVYVVVGGNSRRATVATLMGLAPVASVAGLTGAVTAAQIAAALDTALGSAVWRDGRGMPVTARAADHTLAAGDAYTLLRFTGSDPQVLTVEAGTLSVSDQVSLTQAGTGSVTVAAGAGVTIEKEADVTLALRGQHAVASLVCVAADTYLLVGALAEAGA